MDYAPLLALKLTNIKFSVYFSVLVTVNVCTKQQRCCFATCHFAVKLHLDSFFTKCLALKTFNQPCKPLEGVESNVCHFLSFFF